MSGSGGGGGGGFAPQFDSCETLVINTQLSSPKSGVVEKIQLGDILTLATQAAGGATIVVALYEGKVAGGLASPETGRLRSCLEGGTNYIAKVTGKDDGQIRVRVSAA